MLVAWSAIPSLGHPFFIRTSPIACCGYIARSVLPLPAVCRSSCPLSAQVGLSIAAAGDCLSLRLCAAYRYALIEGRDGSNVPACQRPYAALNLTTGIIISVFFCGFSGGFFLSQCGFFCGFLCLMACVCHSFLCGLCYGHN